MTGRERKEDVAIENASLVQTHRGVERPALVEEPGDTVMDEQRFVADADRNDQQQWPREPGSEQGNGLRLNVHGRSSDPA
jgi:hypothetical protein